MLKSSIGPIRVAAIKGGTGRRPSRATPAEAVAPRPRKAKTVRLPPHISGASAFRRILRSCLEHLVDNEPAAIDGTDIEGVHQARVAIRRLRSALVLFQDHAGAATALEFRRGLRDIGRVLGEARDWDVFLDETLPGFAETRPDVPLPLLRRRARRLRTAAYGAVARSLKSPDHRAFIARIRDWVDGDSWRSGLGLHAFRDLDEPCRTLAPALLDRAARKAAKRGHHLEKLAPEGRHELRKAMKKLRYSAEFMADLFEPKAVKAYLRAVEQLQEVLGNLNDSAARIALYDRAAAGEPILVGAARDRFCAWSEGSTEAALDDLAKVWRKFRKAQPFWN